jgi:predicted RNA binding protein YcfA (HicA-like mRNA interferase family)
MSTFDKLEKKLRDLPTDTEKENILKVFRHYDFEIDLKSGSHIIARHNKLIGIDGYTIDGGVTIPHKHGRKIARIYIKKMFKAIDLIK